MMHWSKKTEQISGQTVAAVKSLQLFSASLEVLDWVEFRVSEVLIVFKPGYQTYFSSANWSVSLAKNINNLTELKAAFKCLIRFTVFFTCSLIWLILDFT